MKTFYSVVLLLACIAWTCTANRLAATTFSENNVEPTESVTVVPDLAESDSDVKQPITAAQNIPKESEATNEIEPSAPPTKRPRKPSKRPALDEHKQVAHPHYMDPLNPGFLPASWPYYPAPGQLPSQLPYPAPCPYTQPMYPYPMPIYSPYMMPNYIYDQMPSTETMSAPSKMELADSTDNTEENEAENLIRIGTLWNRIIAPRPEKGTRIGTLIRNKINAKPAKKT